MLYKAPKIDNIPQWVPIVVKNKDFLIGYIRGKNLIEDLLTDVLEKNNIVVDFHGIDLCLDSSRFNDILENGKRESELSKKELNQYISDMVKNKIDLIKHDHPENKNVFGEYFLRIDCVCELGTYIYKEEENIPSNNLVCELCGRTLIDYTGHDDEEFDYDGDIEDRKGVDYEDEQED